jgi:UDP-glucose 4-epimerase
MNNKKSYLVTGAAGFIGSVLAHKLIKQGHEVVTIDNLSTGFENNIPKGVTFIRGNCQDRGIIDQLASFHFDAIFHIAGQSSGEISFEDPVYDLQTNAQSTLLLLQYALKNNCKKFIYASTMSVYGEQPDGPISEKHPTIPKSFYAVGKLASENYLRIYSEMGIDSIALRLFNVYGPGQNMDNLKQGMVSVFLAQAIKNGHIHVKGSKDRYRDLVYIDDVCNAFLSTIDQKFEGFHIYNVATGTRTTIEELVQILIKNLLNEISVEYKGKTPGDQFGIYGDSTLIKKELRWFPNYTLESGLKKTFDKLGIN